MIRQTLFFTCTLLLSRPVAAQLPNLSPPARLVQTIGDTEITVEYERPAARGRKVFGGLVPYDRVWRTGAGNITKLGFSLPVAIGGQTVPAGKYALLSIPNPEEWLIILNTDTTLYGSRDYDASKDVTRFRVPVTTSARRYESFTIDLDVNAGTARAYLSWDGTEVSFPIETTTHVDALAYIDSLYTAPPSPEADYAWPAEYLFYNRQDYTKALALAEKQLAIEPSEYALRMKFELYERLGYREKALATVDEIFEFLATNPYDEQNMTYSREYWRNERERLTTEGN